MCKTVLLDVKESWAFIIRRLEKKTRCQDSSLLKLSKLIGMFFGGLNWIMQGFKELDEGDSMSLAGDMVRFSNGTELQLFPSAEAHVQEHINGTRRMLGVFRQCSPCTCCDKTRRWCLPTVCCYNIRCGLQGLPYGLCSFIPISCTCFGCRQWTFMWDGYHSGGRFSRLVSGIWLLVKMSVDVDSVEAKTNMFKVEDAAKWFSCFMQ